MTAPRKRPASPGTSRHPKPSTPAHSYVPQAEPIPAFLQENSLADLEEPSVRQSTLAENQIRIPNESGVTGLYHRLPVG